MIAQAHELDLLTTPYVFNPDEARAMTEGRRRHGRRAYGRDHRRLDRRDVGKDARRVRGRDRRHRRRPRSVRKDIILLCHGGPISMPDDASYILERCRDLPRLLRRLEHGAAAGRAALAAQTRSFKAIAKR